MSADAETGHPYRWFLSLWPLAVLFHLAGNDYFLVNLTTVGLAQIPFLAAAVFMLLRPSALAAGALATSHLLVIYLKMPLVGNHEVILLLANIAILLGLITKRDRWLSAAIAPMRWVLLIAYSAIAFSKLNAGFVDRAVSCAAVFGDEFGAWVGVSVSQSAALANLAIVATIVFELSIPVLLMTRRWRRIGVIVGLGFHTVLALEPAGHVFDFTSVLFMLFLLFLTSEESERFSGAVDNLRTNLGTRRMGLMLAVIILGNYFANGIIAFGRVVPNWLFDYPFWLAYAAFVIRHTVAARVEYTVPRPALNFRFAPIMLVAIGLTVLNAASPYLEIRTAGAFNMYSNLAVANGETNHFLLPGTLPLRDVPTLYEAQFDEDNPSPLDFYSRDGLLLIPEPNLAQWANESSAGEVPVALAFADPGAPTSALQVAALVDPADSFLERVFYLRAIEFSDTPQCKRYWGPAH